MLFNVIILEIVIWYISFQASDSLSDISRLSILFYWNYRVILLMHGISCNLLEFGLWQYPQPILFVNYANSGKLTTPLDKISTSPSFNDILTCNYKPWLLNTSLGRSKKNRQDVTVTSILNCRWNWNPWNSHDETSSYLQHV